MLVGTADLVNAELIFWQSSHLVDAELVFGQSSHSFSHVIAERWVPVDDELDVTRVRLLDALEADDARVDQRRRQCDA